MATAYQRLSPDHQPAATRASSSTPRKSIFNNFLTRRRPSREELLPYSVVRDPNDIESQFTGDNVEACFILSTVRLCLEKNVPKISDVSDRMVQYLVNLVMTTRSESNIHAVAGSCVSILTQGSDKYVDRMMDMQQATLRSLVSNYKVAQASRAGAVEFVNFTGSLQYIDLHYAPIPFLDDFLTVLWNHYSVVERTMTTSIKSDCFKRLAVFLLRLSFNTTTTTLEPYQRILISSSSSPLYRIFEQFYESAMVSLRRDSSIIGTIHLTHTILCCMPWDFFLVHGTDWVDACLKHIPMSSESSGSAQVGTVSSTSSLLPPSSPSLTLWILLKTMYVALDPSISQTEHGKEEVLTQWRMIMTTWLAHVRKSKMSESEVTVLVSVFVSSLTSVTKPLLVPFLEMVLKEEKWGVEGHTVGLRVLQAVVKEYRATVWSSNVVVQYVNDMVEQLKDKDLVRESLMILPYLHLGRDERKILAHLKLTIGLTKAKFPELAEKAKRALHVFAQEDPIHCLIPILNHYIHSIKWLHNEYDNSVQLENALDDGLDSIHSLLSTHLTQSSRSDTPAFSQKWGDLREEIEAISIFYFLYVPSPDGPGGKSNHRWVWNKLIAILKLLNHPLYKSYELMSRSRTSIVDTSLWGTFERILEKYEENEKATEERDEDDVVPILASISASSRAFWFEPLYELLLQEWERSSNAFLWAWRQIFLTWNRLPSSATLSPEDVYNLSIRDKLVNTTHAQLVTWINRLRYTMECISLALSKNSTFLSNKEIVKFFTDFNKYLWDNDASTFEALNFYSKVLLVNFGTYSRSLTSFQMFFNISRQYYEDDVQRKVNEAAEKRTEIAPSKPYFQYSAYVYLHYKIITRKDILNTEILRENQDLFKILWRFFKFWIHRDRWNVISTISTAEHYFIGKTVERFIRDVDGYACQRLFKEEVEDDEAHLQSNGDFLVNIRSYNGNIVTFASMLMDAHTVPDLESPKNVANRNILKLVAELLDAILQCGPICTVEEIGEYLHSGNGKATQLFKFLFEVYMANGKTEDVIKEAFYHLLKWNYRLLPAFLQFVRLTPTNVASDSKAKLILHEIAFKSLVENVENHPKRWSKYLSEPDIIEISLRFQCSENVTSRFMAMRLSIALLKNSQRAAAQDVASTAPSPACVERSFYFEKAYQFSSILSLVYGDMAVEVLHTFRQNFGWLSSNEVIHQLNCLVPWIKATSPVIAKTGNLEPARWLLEITANKIQDASMRKVIEQLWRSFLKNKKTDVKFVKLLLEFIITSSLDDDEAKRKLGRECASFLVTGKEGKLIAGTLIELLQEYAFIQDKRLSSFTFELVSDIAFRSPELLLGNLHVVFHHALIFRCDGQFLNQPSAGSRLVWYVFEYLALKYAKSMDELKQIAYLQKTCIADPFSTAISDTKLAKKGKEKIAVELLVNVFKRNQTEIRQEWKALSLHYAKISPTDTIPSALSLAIYMILGSSLENRDLIMILEYFLQNKNVCVDNGSLLLDIASQSFGEPLSYKKVTFIIALICLSLSRIKEDTVSIVSALLMSVSAGDMEMFASRLSLPEARHTGVSNHTQLSFLLFRPDILTNSNSLIDMISFGIRLAELMKNNQQMSRHYSSIAILLIISDLHRTIRSPNLSIELNSKCANAVRLVGSMSSVMSSESINELKDGVHKISNEALSHRKLRVIQDVLKNIMPNLFPALDWAIWFFAEASKTSYGVENAASFVDILYRECSKNDSFSLSSFQHKAVTSLLQRIAIALALEQNNAEALSMINTPTRESSHTNISDRSTSIYDSDSMASSVLKANTSKISVFYDLVLSPNSQLEASSESADLRMTRASLFRLALQHSSTCENGNTEGPTPLDHILRDDNEVTIEFINESKALDDLIIFAINECTNND